MLQFTLWIARFASVVCLVLSVSIFAASFILNPKSQYLSLGKSLHVSAESRGLDSRVVIFNDSEFGPYHGSTLGIEEDTFPQKKGFGDTWGVYYRQFEWPDSTLWTLTVSVWYPIVIFAIIAATFFARRNIRPMEEIAK